MPMCKRQCSGLVWPHLMACRSVTAMICLNPVCGTLGAVHSPGCMMCTACLKVTSHCLVLLHTSSASSLAFPHLGSSHPMCPPNGGLTLHGLLNSHCTAHRCKTYIHPPESAIINVYTSMQLCWDFSPQVISHPLTLHSLCRACVLWCWAPRF